VSDMVITIPSLFGVVVVGCAVHMVTNSCAVCLIPMRTDAHQVSVGAVAALAART
jgi:hypothetical protein